MKYRSILSPLLIVLTLTGCGYQEGISTPEKKAYLYFTGDVKEVKVVIDSNEGFTVEAGLKHKYKITPGKHKVTVYRGEKLIVNREIFVSDGVEKEIEVQK
jgi:hypothetical protein